MKKINKDLERVNSSLSKVTDLLWNIFSKTDLSEVSTKPEKDIGFTNIFMALDELKGIRHKLDSIQNDIVLVNTVIGLHTEFYVVDQEIKLHSLVTHIQEKSQVYLDKESAIKERNRINDHYGRNAHMMKNYVGNMYKVFAYNYELSIFQELKE